jgi:SAM-dependent methyltransferase
MNGFFKCVYCNSSGIILERDFLVCSHCGRRCPVDRGVPLLIKNLSKVESHSRLSPAMAQKVCEIVGIPIDTANLAAVQGIFCWNYHLSNLALTAENNYFLNRARLGESPDRSGIDSVKLPSNVDVQYRFENHFIPRQIPGGRLISRNVRLTNLGRFPISSKAKDGVFISYRWQNSTNETLGWDGIRADLPIDLLPGRSLTVPMRIQTPGRGPGRFFLKLSLIRHDGSWLEVGEQTVPVNVVADYQEPTMPNCLATGKPAPYAEDHTAARSLLLDEVNERLRPGLRILEIGGGCHPQIVGFPGETYNMDIDVQSLQLGRLLQENARTGVSYICGDANEFPFAAKSFDVVALFSALHHFADPVRVLRGIKEILKDDGLAALMCEPVGHYLDEPRPADYIRELEQGINEQAFSIEEYQQMIEDAGFDVARAILDGGSLKALLRHHTIDVGAGKQQHAPTKFAA